MVGEQSSLNLMTALPGVEADAYSEQVHSVYRGETKPGRPVSDRDLPRTPARNTAISREQQQHPPPTKSVIVTMSEATTRITDDLLWREKEKSRRM